MKKKDNGSSSNKILRFTIFLYFIEHILHLRKSGNVISKNHVLVTYFYVVKRP